MSATPAFLPLATNLPGQPGTTTFTHTNGAGLGPCFYRVAVPQREGGTAFWRAGF